MDLVAAGLVTFAVGAGSALLYEASRPWVYHEAAVWGAAWSIAAIDAAAWCMEHPTRRRLAWAALTTTLAMCSRGSVGLAGVAAVGLIAAGNLLARVRARQGERPTLLRRALDRSAWMASAPRRDGRLPVLGPAVAAATPIGVYAVINWIKFHTLFSVPFYGQGFTILDDRRRAFLDHNNGTLFGLKFWPTSLVQYVKPNAFSLTRTFPFIDFPAKAKPFGGVEFDLVDYSSSAPWSMPVFVLLAVIGVALLVRRSTRRPARGSPRFRGPVIGALFGALTILPFGYIANRYLADCLPVLLIAGLIGLHALLPRVASGGRRRVDSSARCWRCSSSLACG